MILVAADVLNRALNNLGDSLPRIAGALLLLVIGIPIAWIIGRIVCRLLRAIGADDFAERVRIHDVIARFGLERSLSQLLGRAVRIVLVIVVIVAAVSLLGLGALSIALNEVVLFLPKLFIALLLMLAGAVIADFLADRTRRLSEQMALGGPLPELVRGGTLALFVLIALAEIGIPTMIVIAVLALIVTGITLTFALAFGLGGRDVAREVTAGRYVTDAFSLGQTITLGDVSGEIVSLDRAATVLRTATGSTVRVPNHFLVGSIVTLEEQTESAAPGGSA